MEASILSACCAFLWFMDMMACQALSTSSPGMPGDVLLDALPVGCQGGSPSELLGLVDSLLDEGESVVVDMRDADGLGSSSWRSFLNFLSQVQYLVVHRLESSSEI